MKGQIKVGAEGSSQRLDVFLAGKNGVTRSQWQQHLKAGRITVNGQVAKGSLMLEGGETIVYNWPATKTVKSQRPALRIIHEDADLIVIDKPAGVLVHPAPGRAGEPTVANFVRTMVDDPDSERPGIVHRLDRDTSGLLLVAKNPESKRYLQKLFRDHAVHKTYQVLVVGKLEPPAAVINLPIKLAKTSALKRAVGAGGKPAVTKYHTVANFNGYTLVKAEPTTGRTHQLRAHFSHLGHPIAGDPTYGVGRRPQGLSRQFLHASELKFVGPNGQDYHFTSPLPPELANFLAVL